MEILKYREPDRFSAKYDATQDYWACGAAALGSLGSPPS